MATLGLWVQVGTRNTPLHVKGHTLRCRAQAFDAEVYTDDSAGLGQKLAHDVAKASAVKLRTDCAADGTFLTTLLEGD